MNKAIFLDRDGTINVDKNYLYKIEDWEFIRWCNRRFTDITRIRI